MAYNPYNQGQFNTSLPTLSSGQYSVIQVDSNGRILLAPASVPLSPAGNVRTQDSTPGTQPIFQEILMEMRALRRLMFLIYQESGEGDLTNDLLQDVNGADTSLTS